MSQKNNSPFPPSAQIVAYLRDSGGDDQDLSVPQQEAALRAWCAENDLTLSRIFADIAAPGSTIVGRDAFQSMMHYFRAPHCPASGLVVWKFSRFARSQDDAQLYKAELRKLGFIIHSITDNIPDGIDGRLFEAAVDWMNEKFLQSMSEDVKRGLAHIVQTLGAIPGRPPTGFLRQAVDAGRRRDGSPHILHRWAPDPAQIDTIRLAYTMRARRATLQQVHAATRLCGSLNSYTTFFRNPLYRGELHYADLVIPNYCDPIVDEATWHAAQSIPQPTHPRRAHSQYLLSGLVYCAQCGSPMNGHTIHIKKHSEPYDYYRCARSHRRRDCQALPIQRQALETLVLAHLTTDVLSPDMIANHQAGINLQQEEDAAQATAERTELNKRQAQLTKRIANVVNTLADVGSSPALIAKLKAMETEQSQIQSSLAELSRPQTIHSPSPAQIGAAAARIQQFIDDPEHQNDLRSIFHALINKITVERKDRVIRGLLTYYHPPGVLEFVSMNVLPRGGTRHRHKFVVSLYSKTP
jgi:site-specific DNA recombinase